MTITPELLRKLASQLEKAQADVVKELEKHIKMKTPEVTRVHIPVVGKREVTFKRPEEKIFNFNQPMESQTRHIKKTDGVTHRISKRINLNIYKHLRKAGFCAGMKFKLIDYKRFNKVVVRHVRSGKTAVISANLLEVIPNGE